MASSINLLFLSRTLPPFKNLEIVASERPVSRATSLIVVGITTHPSIAKRFVCAIELYRRSLKKSIWNKPELSLQSGIHNINSFYLFRIPEIQEKSGLHKIIFPLSHPPRFRILSPPFG